MKKRFSTILLCVCLAVWMLILASCKAAVSVVSAFINDNGELVLSMSDGSTQNLGKVTGKDGKDGIDGEDGETGATGAQGVQGEKGDTGSTGAAGADGTRVSIGFNGNWWLDGVDSGIKAEGVNGISPRVRINQNTNMWELSTDDGQTWGSLGIKATGENGKNGADGKDAIAPQICINATTNEWEVSADGGKTWVTTGVKATGATGAPGQDGEDGKDGVAPQIRINPNTSEWEVSADGGKTWTSTGVKATGADGQDGEDGKNGEDGEDGKDAIAPHIRMTPTPTEWEVSTDRGKTWTSTGVKATGADGQDGEDGKDGEDGEDGKDAIAPQIRINATTNEWEVSADGGKTWTTTGVKATGEQGQKGQQGAAGATIQKIEFDAQGRLVITLTDGSVLDPVDLPEKEEHQHEFDEWVIYNGNEQTPCHDRIYYHTCIKCFEMVWRRGRNIDHIYVNNSCERCGEKLPSEGLKFVSNGDGTCYLEGMGTCADAYVVIPEKSTDGDLVTSIGDLAFYQKDVISVVCPESVTIIGDIVFGGCELLKSIVLPSELTYLGHEAFRQCKALESITLPSTLTYIGRSVFYGCSALQHTEYEDGEYLGNEENPYLYLNFVNKGIENFSIPNTTRFVSATFGGTSISSITIPNSVILIDDGSFGYCYNLETILFENDSQLKFIGNLAFASCNSLVEVSIPASVTYIGDEAFYNCTSLQTVLFGTNSQLEYIGYGAFEDCTMLKSITFPANLTYIGLYAFRGCRNLNQAIFEGDRGWNLSNDPTCVTVVTSVTASALEDSYSAAMYLNSTLCDYHWFSAKE